MDRILFDVRTGPFRFQVNHDQNRQPAARLQTMMTYEHGRIATLVEGIAESTTACLVVMVQGNMLAITLGHLAIASETGVIAGATASIVVLVARIKLRWIFSVALGTVTAVVDFFVHPGHFGPVIMEALVTGLGAGVLSFLLGMAIHRLRARS